MTTTQHEALSRNRPGGRPLEVLIADAERAAHLEGALEQRGFRVRCCNQLRDARAMLDGGPLDLVVMELRLLDGPSLALIELLRRQNRDAKILVLTAYGSVASAVSCMRAGANGFLSKPADVDRVLAAAFGDMPQHASVPDAPCTLARALWEFVNRAVQAKGSISRGAEHLGIDRRSLRRMLSKYAPI